MLQGPWLNLPGQAAARSVKLKRNVSNSFPRPTTTDNNNGNQCHLLVVQTVTLDNSGNRRHSYECFSGASYTWRQTKTKCVNHIVSVSFPGRTCFTGDR